MRPLRHFMCFVWFLYEYALLCVSFYGTLASLPFANESGYSYHKRTETLYNVLTAPFNMA